MSVACVEFGVPDLNGRRDKGGGGDVAEDSPPPSSSPHPCVYHSKSQNGLLGTDIK